MIVAIALENIEINQELLTGLPPSAVTIYKIVTGNGPITSREIVDMCNLAPRTVRHGLKLLVRAGLIQKLPHLLDMRSCKFYVD
ncbi:MAG: helix-turn-helix transcriptional regulator [Candidatus Heimdallarchaeota archaeon]|nr:helix-turn-helix transcriptional regulator [Candidatus Heimdallarchaeota archaeon]